MKRRRHVDAIARRVAEEVERTPPRTARRLRRELAAVAFDLDPVLAREVGALELVERCREDHLASLDADDGLLVLGISWEEIVARVDGFRTSRVEPRRGRPTRRRAGAPRHGR